MYQEGSFSYDIELHVIQIFHTLKHLTSCWEINFITERILSEMTEAGEFHTISFKNTLVAVSYHDIGTFK